MDLEVAGIRCAPLSLSISITCTATTSTSKSRSRSKSRSQSRNSHAKMEFQKNYAALVWQPAPTVAHAFEAAIDLRVVWKLHRSMGFTSTRSCLRLEGKWSENRGYNYQNRATLFWSQLAISPIFLLPRSKNKRDPFPRSRNL